MNSRERLRAQRQLEALVLKIVKRGWRLDCISTCDEKGEDFTATITLSIAGFDVEEKGVM